MQEQSDSSYSNFWTLARVWRRGCVSGWESGRESGRESPALSYTGCSLAIVGPLLTSPSARGELELNFDESTSAALHRNQSYTARKGTEPHRVTFLT
jgi:hypothetical protein